MRIIEKQIVGLLIKSILVLLLVAPLNSSAEETLLQDDPLRSRISLYCVQGADDNVTLVSKLRYRQDRQYFNIVGAEVTFTGESENGPLELGSAITDDNGEAKLIIPSDAELSLNEDSLFTVYAEYVGSEEYRASDTDFEFKKARLIVNADVVDSTYVVNIETYELNENQTPIGDQDVFVMVPRMFSNLTLANEYSDDDGQLSVTIPSDVPADLDDKLEIIVQIPDTDEYGTLEASVVTDCGVIQEQSSVKTRELWSPDAPLWMLITFIILMSIVWGHYLIIIYKLYLVKVEGKTIENKT